MPRDLARIPCLVVLLTLVAACGGGDAKPASEAPEQAGGAPKAAATGEGGTQAKKRAAKADRSAPTTRTVTVSDPVEDAFTVKVPKGWDTQAYSTGQFDVHREVVNSVSPDGGTVLFLGDPKIPNYWNPETANPITVQFAEQLDYMELQSYTPAGEFLPKYADDKFGKLPGFEITRFEDNEKTVRSVGRQFAAAGLPEPEAHAVNAYFTYDDEGREMNGVLVAVTINSGEFWQADVSGLSTDRSVKAFFPMLSAMARSKRTNPEFTARQNANHAERMAQIQANTEAMTQQHNANMAAIQGSAERHQARMDAISDAGDASMRSYNERMASGDENQRQFLNYVNDETTVVNSSGQTHQVDDGYQTYYMKKGGDKYVGGDINFDESSIRELGLDPGDYERVEVKK